MCRAPVRISFPSLDLSFWSINGLSKLASAAEQPLFVDKCTMFKEHIAYACVLMEVDVSSALPEIVTV